MELHSFHLLFFSVYDTVAAPMGGRLVGADCSVLLWGKVRYVLYSRMRISLVVKRSFEYVSKLSKFHWKFALSRSSSLATSANSVNA